MEKKNKNPCDKADCEVYVKLDICVVQKAETQRGSIQERYLEGYSQNVNIVCFGELLLGVIYLILLFFTA